MDANKKITRAGGVSLPAYIRRAYGIEAGEKVNINVNEAGVIEVTRIEGSCIFCQAHENLQRYQGRYVCSSCLEQLRGL